MAGAYYNEIDPFAAAWLRALMADGLIAPGVVDERSILEVTANDLEGFQQCHFFAGIGGWSAALRLAGWADNRPVWTGSCPCQPFSIAGKIGGVQDQRHLWPAWHGLIKERGPAVVFGEQVASQAGFDWLAGVHLEMEAAGYSFAAASLCAASVQARHPRNRIFFVADAGREGLARPVTDREGVRDGQSAAPAQHGHDSLHARFHIQPDPRTVVPIDGLPRPVGIVRGFGNAIHLGVAAEYISAAEEAAAAT